MMENNQPEEDEGAQLFTRSVKPLLGKKLPPEIVQYGENSYFRYFKPIRTLVDEN